MLLSFNLFDDRELEDLSTWLKYIRSVLNEEGKRVVLVAIYQEDRVARDKRLQQIAQSINVYFPSLPPHLNNFCKRTSERPIKIS